jgi:hypothetical protein
MSGTPIQFSSERMRRLKADWVMLRSSAARVKLSVRPRHTKSRSQLISMAISLRHRGPSCKIGIV